VKTRSCLAEWGRKTVNDLICVMLRTPIQILRFIQETYTSQHNGLRNITTRFTRYLHSQIISRFALGPPHSKFLQLCDPLAGKWCEHPHGSRADGAQGCEDDGDLYACDEQGSGCGEESAGSVLTRENAGSRSCAWREGFQPFPPYNLPVGMGRCPMLNCVVPLAHESPPAKELGDIFTRRLIIEGVL